VERGASWRRASPRQEKKLVTLYQGKLISGAAVRLESDPGDVRSTTPDLE
jgi:hypothetical protein